MNCLNFIPGIGFAYHIYRTHQNDKEANDLTSQGILPLSNPVSLPPREKLKVITYCNQRDRDNGMGFMGALVRIIVAVAAAHFLRNRAYLILSIEGICQQWYTICQTSKLAPHYDQRLDKISVATGLQINF